MLNISIHKDTIANIQLFFECAMFRNLILNYFISNGLLVFCFF